MVTTLWNRGSDENIAAAMGLVNTCSFNGWDLPRGMNITACSNPAATGSRVKTPDEAQYTRFVYAAFTPKRQLFYDNLELQGVPELAIAMAVVMRDTIAPSRPSENYLPRERPLNKRNFTMFWQLYAALKHSPDLLDMVSCSVFGSNVVVGLEERLNGDIPLEPHAVIGVNPLERKAGIEGDDPEDASGSAKAKLRSWSRERKTDLIGVTLNRLVRHLNKENTHLSDSQFEAFCDVMLGVDKELARAAMRNLIMESSPRCKLYRPKIHYWRSPDGNAAGELAQRVFADSSAVAAQIRAELAEAG